MFDVLTTAAVADELAATILDGRIQRIGLVDRRTIAAEIYAGGRRHALVASADDQAPRLHLAPAMPSLDADLVTPFGLLLRKYLRGGLVIGVEQPPLERLVRLSIAKRLPSDHERRARRRGGEPATDGEIDRPPTAEEEDDEGEGDATFVHLAVEVMGRHSNLILIADDGTIMDATKRVTPAMSRVRPIAPRLPYLPPPPITKPDPRQLTAAAATDLLAALLPQTEIAKGLVTALRGVSPQMAREIAFRTSGSAEVTVGDMRDLADGSVRLARETRLLLEPLLTAAWSPRLYRKTLATSSGDGDEVDGEPGEVVAYAPVAMAHLAATLVEEPAPSISVAIALGEGVGGATTAPLRHAQRRERLLESIRAAREKQGRRLAAVREQGVKAAEAESLRRWGELIYANLWQIRPGEDAFEVEGERVVLLPGLSAKETAQEYFERYRKAQSAGVHQEELEAEIATEVAHLDQLATLAAQAAGFAELEALTG
ncbi:MAG TPA: NFACT family protein, partial [Thermomicrobiales bacterium]|nr:NFACT family protein [Thermomicrobiales bacterium]